MALNVVIASEAEQSPIFDNNEILYNIKKTLWKWKAPMVLS
jgi:hypothetical protein